MTRQDITSGNESALSQPGFVLHVEDIINQPMIIYTIQDIAKLLHCNKQTVVMLIKNGRIKAFKLGRMWRVRAEEYNNFINQ